MDYDIVVIGGGLGGATLAKALAERGRSVLVLERETHFSDRVRGEQMHPWGVTAAGALGVYEPLLQAGSHQTRWWNRYAGGLLAAPRDLVATTPHAVGSFHCFHPDMQETLIRLASEASAEVLRGVTVARGGRSVGPPGPAPFGHPRITRMTRIAKAGTRGRRPPGVDVRPRRHASLLLSSRVVRAHVNFGRQLRWRACQPFIKRRGASGFCVSDNNPRSNPRNQRNPRTPERRRPDC